ncbi:hypothetical protein LCGC14_0773670 [marine sediment metagenome]|uniref:Uncharacterized protein n=1 Tax=marine sediment metagenome TaxID=412755 RepID=A0A0F9PXR7_9ZZZZ
MNEEIEMEKLTVGDKEIEVSKTVAETLRNQGRNQATTAFIQKAIKVKPDEMEIGEKTKPGKLIEQLFGMVQQQTKTIAEYEAKTKETKEQEPEELKQAKLELATKSNEINETKAKLYSDFAKEQAIADVMSSAKRDFNLTEESEGLFPGMVATVFDYDVEPDGNDGFSVTFSKKGESFPFMPDSKPPTSKQLAELISKQYPGNHGNGVPAGGGTRRTVAPGNSSGKPIHEQSTREIEERAWA